MLAWRPRVPAYCENVDRAELRHGLIDDRSAMLGILDIPCDEHHLAACFFHQSLALVRVLLLVEIGDQHIGALAREGESDGAADSAVAACHDRLHARQSTSTFVSPLAV